MVLEKPQGEEAGEEGGKRPLIFSGGLGNAGERTNELTIRKSEKLGKGA